MPSTTEAAPSTAAGLRTRGWSLLRDQPFLRPCGTADPERILALAAHWGRPSARDGGRALWPVRPSDPAGTFSLRAGAVPPHTDAAYRRRPEERVCLFAVRPAADGGHTRLLDAGTALRGLAPGMIERLQRPDWSWRVPAPFGPEPPFQAAVVTADRRVRWRADLLRPPCDRAQRDTAESFADHLRSGEDAVELRLEAGDVLVLDNRRILHGRTAFTDPGRLLIRVRLWTLP